MSEEENEKLKEVLAEIRERDKEMYEKGITWNEKEEEGNESDIKEHLENLEKNVTECSDEVFSNISDIIEELVDLTMYKRLSYDKLMAWKEKATDLVNKAYINCNIRSLKTI